MNKYLNPSPAVMLKCGLHKIKQHPFPVLSDWMEDLGGTSSWRRGCEMSATVWSFRGRKPTWGRSQRLTGGLRKLIQGVATAWFPAGSQLAGTCSLHHRGMGCSLHLSSIYLGKVALWAFAYIWGFREYYDGIVIVCIWERHKSWVLKCSFLSQVLAECSMWYY